MRQGSPTARLSVLGPCLQWGCNPSTAQTLGGEEPRPASSRNHLSLHGGRNRIHLLGPRPRLPLFPRVFSLWFFSLNGGSCNGEGLSTTKEEEAKAARPPWCYVGQSKNPEKEEWIYSVE